MQTGETFDSIVIGAGIAGATVSAALAAEGRVALIEAEEVAAFHTTGRSAAIWVQNYGPPDVRALTAASRAFFEDPPPGFTETPLMSRRAVVLLATAAQRAKLDDALAAGIGMRAIAVDTVRDMVPALRPGYAAAAAIEEDAFDMDVAALHGGFLRQLRARGGQVALRSRTAAIERSGGAWHVQTSGGTVFSAPVLVNCAGAWGDEVAAQAGATPIGLVPKRRTACIIDPAPWQPTDWPCVMDVGGEWYVRTEARTRLMVSPADETPMHAHDVQPEELDVAVAIDRMSAALDITVRRIEHSWAGLRTFAPDGSLAFGWDRRAEGFFWCVGQGGYGIQTSPAAGQLVADLIAGRPVQHPAILSTIDPGRFQA